MERNSDTISIHALLTESDPKYHRILLQHSAFLSTLSLRRATFRSSFLFNLLFHFYPRSPYGERHHKKAQSMYHNTISIHALLTESDSLSGSSRATVLVFLSTLSLRRATTKPIDQHQAYLHFYPRSPYGERLTSVVSSTGTTGFLSTLSLRRATNLRRNQRQRKHISIHALLTESDESAPNRPEEQKHFYPRSPYGERLSALASKQNPTQHFYPRSPYGERQ